MADGVEVDISDVAIISALNTPGGAVFQWRDETARLAVNTAIARSPVNNPLNAQHRGGVVGTYKASWGWDRVGSNGHRVRAVIYNGANHADIVEFGRHRSTGQERFSWTGWRPPGSIQVAAHGTRGRAGHHILEDSVNAAVRLTT